MRAKRQNNFCDGVGRRLTVNLRKR